MSLPDKCPFCGAAIAIGEDGKKRVADLIVIFDCGSGFDELIDPIRTRSRACKAITRVAELEAEAKQARDDDAWAEDNGVVIDAEPVEKGWCAMLVREDGPLIEVPSAKGPTIHAAIRALREKVEGGAR